jgi:hypothetical protein
MAQKNPSGGLRGNFRGAQKWSHHVCAPRKCEEGVAVHLLHDLPLLPRPPHAPRLAPPLQDFQGVRGRFKEGCLDRLRRCGRFWEDRDPRDMIDDCHDGSVISCVSRSISQPRNLSYHHNSQGTLPDIPRIQNLLVSRSKENPRVRPRHHTNATEGTP